MGTLKNTTSATWAAVPSDPSAYGSETSDDDAERYHDRIMDILRGWGWGNEIESMVGTDEEATLIYAPDYSEDDDNDYTQLADDAFFGLLHAVGSETVGQ